MFQQIHIVACCPRSGTTLLHEAMVTCFKVDKFYDHERRFHKTNAEDGQILISKRPKDTYYMEKVLAATPGFHVIYLMRDPRDVIVSRHGKNKEIYYANFALWQHLHSFGKRLSQFENVLEVRYEDFVTDPNAVQTTIMAKFPWLKKQYEFSDYHLHARVSDASEQALKGVRPISPASVGTWKQNLGRIKAQWQRHNALTATLIECGYESDGDWEKVLSGVEPDMTPSHYPEAIGIFKKLSLKLHGLLKVRQFKRSRQLD